MKLEDVEKRKTQPKREMRASTIFAFDGQGLQKHSSVPYLKDRTDGAAPLA
jgi:hypothetical protein